MIAALSYGDGSGAAAVGAAGVSAAEGLCSSAGAAAVRSEARGRSRPSFPAAWRIRRSAAHKRHYGTLAALGRTLKRSRLGAGLSTPENPEIAYRAVLRLGGGGVWDRRAQRGDLGAGGGLTGGLRKPRTARPRPSPRVRGFQGSSSVPPSVALLRLDGRLLDLGLAGRGGRR